MTDEVLGDIVKIISQSIPTKQRSTYRLQVDMLEPAWHGKNNPEALQDRPQYNVNNPASYSDTLPTLQSFFGMMEGPHIELGSSHMKACVERHEVPR